MSGDIVSDVMARAGAGYQILYVDPPWKFDGNSKENPGRSAMRHYPLMTVKEIAAIPVLDMVADEAALFLWITTPMLAIGAHIPVMRAWGFKPCAVGFVWVKTKRSVPWHHRIAESDLHIGNGLTTRKNTELVMIGKRGRSFRVDAGVHEVVIAPVREHSRKPLEVARRIVRYVGPALKMCEMFSRETFPGFDALGNDAGKFDVAAE